MRYEVSTPIEAPPERVWSVLTDVESMPAWTPSMTEVQRLDSGPLAVGSTVRITQPRLPAAVWRVTELTPLRGFSWSTTSAGVTTTGGHILSGDGGSPTVVTFTIEQRGLLAPLVGLVPRSLTRRYVDAELLGLKSRCERATIAEES